MADCILADFRSDMVWRAAFAPLERDADMCRIILPLLGEYVDSGYRTPKDRILYSLRSNARYQLIVLTCATAGLIYVSLQNGFEGTSVKSLVMALAYCWGLIQAIFLMGHGLVAVPRRLFRNASVSGRLRRIQVGAPKVHDTLEDAVTELNELESQLALLRQRKTGISRDHLEWIGDIAETTNITAPAMRRAPLATVSSTPIPAVITDRYLADLTRKLTRARHKRIRFADGWNRLVQEAADLQTILDATASKRLDLGKPLRTASRLEQITVLTPYLRYLLSARILPVIRITFGAVFTVASVCVIWSELVKSTLPQLSIISLTVLRYPNGKDAEVRFTGQLIAIMWISYMCFTALASFDDVKVWGNRALVRRNTYSESACWYAGQIAKLTTPLTYNFVTLLSGSIYRKTIFHQFLGRWIVLTPLGKGFDYFFPILILIPVCATLFNLYGRVKNGFGFGIIEDDGEEYPSGFGTGGWREGRDLIDRELHGRSDLDFSTALEGRSASPLPPHRVPTVPGARQQRPIRQPRAEDTPTRSDGQSDLAQRQAQRLSYATRAAEEDEGLFAGFAHRFRNTMDAVERPDWLPDLGKRPKWMGGADDSSGRADAGRGLGRWFGGRPADGRVRL